MVKMNRKLKRNYFCFGGWTKLYSDLCREIGGACGRFCRVPVEIDTPDSALMTRERSNPVTGVTLAQHRLAI